MEPLKSSQTRLAKKFDPLDTEVNEDFKFSSITRYPVFLEAFRT
jgi:hypothetical protein